MSLRGNESGQARSLLFEPSQALEWRDAGRSLQAGSGGSLPSRFGSRWEGRVQEDSYRQLPLQVLPGSVTDFKEDGKWKWPCVSFSCMRGHGDTQMEAAAPCRTAVERQRNPKLETHGLAGSTGGCLRMACKLGQGLQAEHRAAQEFSQQYSRILFLIRCLSTWCAENSLMIWIHFPAVKYFFHLLRVTFVQLAFCSGSALFLSPVGWWWWQPLHNVSVTWAILGKGLRTVPGALEEHGEGYPEIWQ